MAGSHEKVTYTAVGIRGDFEIFIGNSPSCKVCVQGIHGIASKHAILKRKGDSLFIKDLGSQAGTYLNKTRLPQNRWKEITRHDQITICNVPVKISEKLFLGRDRVGLATTRLHYADRGKDLCQGVYLRAEPGTLTAIMGPSGAGKSVFLKLINGYYRPTKGRVIIGDKPNIFDLHRHLEHIRDFLGYVPQEDLMIPELTVRQSLHYRLRLRFPEMEALVRQKLIDETCEQLGFASSRREKFLDTHIEVLSGGERKRANIALELITKPLILILDEPTSGLSSMDSVRIVALLKELARRDKLTIIATIHQPGRKMFSMFDNLMLLGYGGLMGYFGPSDKATDYVLEVTGRFCGERNPAEFLMELFE